MGQRQKEEDPADPDQGDGNQRTQIRRTPKSFFLDPGRGAEEKMDEISLVPERTWAEEAELEQLLLFSGRKWAEV